MTFYIRNYSSDEKYDISKFMNYQEGVYDVLDSPFLNSIKQLPTVQYYYVDSGFKEVDLISLEVYGTPFFAYLIQYYNSMFQETFKEGTVLNLFSAEDLNSLYFQLTTKSNLNDSEES